MMGGDPRYGGSPGAITETLKSHGYSDWEIRVFQAVQIGRVIVQSNPQIMASCGGG
jgi:hypothetical protein